MVSCFRFVVWLSLFYCTFNLHTSKTLFNHPTLPAVAFFDAAGANTHPAAHHPAVGFWCHDSIDKRDTPPQPAAPGGGVIDLVPPVGWSSGRVGVSLGWGDGAGQRGWGGGLCILAGGRWGFTPCTMGEGTGCGGGDRPGARSLLMEHSSPAMGQGSVGGVVFGGECSPGWALAARCTGCGTHRGGAGGAPGGVMVDHPGCIDGAGAQLTRMGEGTGCGVLALLMEHSSPHQGSRWGGGGVTLIYRPVIFLSLAVCAFVPVPMLAGAHFCNHHGCRSMVGEGFGW